MLSWILVKHENCDRGLDIRCLEHDITVTEQSYSSPHPLKDALEVRVTVQLAFSHDDVIYLLERKSKGDSKKKEING